MIFSVVNFVFFLLGFSVEVEIEVKLKEVKVGIIMVVEEVKVLVKVEVFFMDDEVFKFFFRYFLEILEVYEKIDVIVEDFNEFFIIVNDM